MFDCSQFACRTTPSRESRIDSHPSWRTVTHVCVKMQPALEWNAGKMGCGELLVELHLRMREMEPGQVFRLLSFDPAAPEEMPAWCRLTGHRLMAANHPEYLIQRKEK